MGQPQSRTGPAGEDGRVPLPSQNTGHTVSPSFVETFGEELRQILDINSWRPGVDLSQEYDRIEREVREAVEQEEDWQRDIRERVLPRLEWAENAPKNAGKHEADLNLIAQIHPGLLFNGGVEACDGTLQTHDTLPLTIYQIGVSLVSYRGDQGTWCQRLFRRDLRQSEPNPVEDIIGLLERRNRRGALNRTSSDDSLGELVQRTIMAYAERAILLRHSKAVWLMGHGNPIPYELLTGGGVLELMVAATRIMRQMVEGHKKFVYVASEPRDRMLLTIGQALRPMEFAIVETLDHRVRDWFRQFRFSVGVTDRLDWDGEELTPSQWIPRFIDRVASQVVVGLYRATRLAPAQMFYAHVDHSDLAAHIALADSMLQAHRGFPLLIDVAHNVCGAVFAGSLDNLTRTAYSAAGAPWRYFSERSTRNV